ncbi:MAG: DUF3078 domain-containing protein [Bacteroidota bacterium]
MKYIYALIICLFIGSSSYAQTDTSWVTGGVFTLNFNQTSLTNWAAGGENSIAGNSLLNVFAKYKKNRLAWDNSLDLAYGLLKAGEKEFRKSDDKIDLLSKLGYDANDKNKWFYTVLFNFKSQFTNSYEYPTDTTKVLISKFAAPAYILLALGMDFKPNPALSVFISPITMKTTVVSDQDLADAGAFGVDPAEFDATTGAKTKDGEMVRMEYGAYINAKFQKDVMTNVNFLTKLDLFSNYADNPQNIDVNWEVLIAMKINKYLSASINTNLIYDDNVTIQEYDVINGYKIPKFNSDGTTVAGPRVQFKEVIGVGLSMKF